jgi:hypothetical protein
MIAKNDKNTWREKRVGNIVLASKLATTTVDACFYITV